MELGVWFLLFLIVFSCFLYLLFSFVHLLSISHIFLIDFPLFLLFLAKWFSLHSEKTHSQFFRLSSSRFRVQSVLCLLSLLPFGAERGSNVSPESAVMLFFFCGGRGRIGPHRPHSRPTHQLHLKYFAQGRRLLKPIFTCLNIPFYLNTLRFRWAKECCVITRLARYFHPIPLYVWGRTFYPLS